jgi:hypothetical protein
MANPFALGWGGITLFVGRLYNKEFIRGFAFLWKTVFKLNFQK